MCRQYRRNDRARIGWNYRTSIRYSRSLLCLLRCRVSLLENCRIWSGKAQEISCQSILMLKTQLKLVWVNITTFYRVDWNWKSKLCFSMLCCCCLITIWVLWNGLNMMVWRLIETLIWSFFRGEIMESSGRSLLESWPRLWCSFGSRSTIWRQLKPWDGINTLPGNYLSTATISSRVRWGSFPTREFCGSSPSTPTIRTISHI